MGLLLELPAPTPPAQLAIENDAVGVRSSKLPRDESGGEVAPLRDAEVSRRACCRARDVDDDAAMSIGCGCGAPGAGGMVGAFLSVVSRWNVTQRKVDNGVPRRLVMV